MKNELNAFDKLSYANNKASFDKITEEMRTAVRRTEEAIEAHKAMESRLAMQLETTKASRIELESSLERQMTTLKQRHQNVRELLERAR